MDTSPTISARRQKLFAELAELTAIERGTLYEEYREVPDPNGPGTVRLGPYFKHQCWEEGRNRSMRIPALQIDSLRQDLAQGLQFDAVTKELATLALAESRQRRSLGPPAVDSPAEGKKNSTPRAKPPGGRKPKRA